MTSRTTNRVTVRGVSKNPNTNAQRSVHRERVVFAGAGDLNEKQICEDQNKNISVFVFYLHEYETEHICVCIEKHKCGSGNTGVNPSVCMCVL